MMNKKYPIYYMASIVLELMVYYVFGAIIGGGIADYTGLWIFETDVFNMLIGLAFYTIISALRGDFKIERKEK